MTEREALKLALEALEEAKLHIWLGDKKGVAANIKCHQTITAIKEALAQPEQEPEYVTYAGNGTAGFSEGERPTGFFIQSDKRQPQPWEKFCDSNCVWTDHHPDCKLAQPDQYAKGYADAMNWKVQNHLEHLPAAQPEQEPVIVGRWPSAAIGRETLQDAIERERAVGYREGHRAALAQRTWVGLTDEDWNRSKHNYDFQKGVDWAESILKKKNT